MKKNILIALLMTIVFTANATAHRGHHREVQAMTDFMATELRLSNHQYHKVYDINLRLFDNPVARDRALRHVLSPRQYHKYQRIHHAAMRHNDRYNNYGRHHNDRHHNDGRYNRHHHR